MSEKIKVLTLGDHPLLPSGVGIQSRYIIEALLDSGKFQVISFGGAVSHPNYDPSRTDKYGEDWTIFPVDGYGDKDRIRSILRYEKPDILWFMTDPRYYEWLWMFEDEVRPLIPMVYYHVWDNYPYPNFNKNYYDSTDVIATISKVTSDIVQTVSPDVEEHYIPHAVDTNIFKKRKKTDPAILSLTEGNPELQNKFVCFWNNRNARRKQTGTLIYWFKEFLDQVGRENAALVMHTDMFDPHGQDLGEIITNLGVDNGEIQFSTDKISSEHMSLMYNMADLTINIADAEGFGLSTLESLACETPVLVNMTGGLQEQVTDGENWFGVGITPASKAIIGSQNVPYIYEDRLNKEDFLDALTKMYNMSKTERNKLGKAGRQHVLKNYNFKDYGERWVELLLSVHEKYGSWENRKGYKSWEITQL
jgi:glycosyltransferase involved in cell wall biosynthesis